MSDPLGTYGDSPTPPLRRQRNRADREGLKLAQRHLTESVSSKLCWYGSGMTVTVDIGAALTAHVSGIKRCGSPWACLLCSPIVRERRAMEIDLGVSGHLERGGSALFVTFTLRHHRTDALGPRLAAVSEALNLTLSGAPWSRRKVALGYVGAIRATEITDGINGWHPHCHALLLFDRPMSDEHLVDLLAWLRGRWGGVVVRKGFGTINGHGVDLRRVAGAGDLAGYLCKVESGWGVGLELARSDLKGSSPLEHLRQFAATGEVVHAARWREYEAATFGKRAIRWSPGLRALLLGLEDEQSDEDLAKSEGLDLALMRAVIPRAEVWDPAVRSGRATALLTELEQIGALLLSMSTNPQPLEVPCGQAQEAL